eukprot:1158495-Pelagomonas_calceolata.AAC.5
MGCQIAHISRHGAFSGTGFLMSDRVPLATPLCTRRDGAMGAPGPPLAGLASQGGHAHSNSPAATYHHYHHHHHQ